MPKKYHVDITPVLPRYLPVGKFATLEFREDCAGACRKCVRKKCIYQIFQDERSHIEQMRSMEYLYICNGCFRCVQECTKGIFTMVINPEYRTLGDKYWTPEIISSLWYQAETAKIPVSGAGYGGPFVGPGFDSMWTDMSEIVRPTRDGIHGREYINTSIDLGRQPSQLMFGSDLSLTSELNPLAESLIPMIFNPSPFGGVGPNVLEAMAAAAQKLGTFMIIRAEDYFPGLAPYGNCLIPSLSSWQEGDLAECLKAAKIAELSYQEDVLELSSRLQARYPELIVAIRIPLTPVAAAQAVQLTEKGAEILHFTADEYGQESETETPRFIKDTLRDIHLALVDRAIRDEVTILASGGIAMAEHMAKAIICGTDGVGVDLALLVALECRLCRRCTRGLSCPVTLSDISPDWGTQRIINLMYAWRSQLIEVLGAMGIREVRRLRGEMGRAMLFEDLERETFGELFGERKTTGDLVFSGEDM